MGLKESTGIWGKTPLRWPLAVAGLTFFVVAGGFAVADDDARVMLYTSVVMGSTLVGAWIYSLGASRYSGESPESVSDIRRPAQELNPNTGRAQHTDPNGLDLGRNGTTNRP